MSVMLDELSRLLLPRLRTLGFTMPTMSILRELLRVSYCATLRTEEGRFIRASLTYADPMKPEVRSPFTRRADYPAFTALGNKIPLSVDSLVKLARAVDKWSGSIAVWGTNSGSLFAWGIVDQLVATNMVLHHEEESGFSYPGILTISMDGVADLAAYHGAMFLGGLKADDLIRHQNDAFRHPVLVSRIKPSLAPTASCIAKALESPRDTSALLSLYIDAWSVTVARLCIGLRRIGTGGSLLITPAPLSNAIQLTNSFKYTRLGDSIALQVLDWWYRNRLQERRLRFRPSANVPWDVSAALSFAETDAEDRDTEVRGAVKLVTSLAAVDGLVLFSPTLSVLGFGIKIGPSPPVQTVYDGPGFVRWRTKAKKVELSGFGTRHNAMLRYCRADPSSVGIVVSQDGSVRLIISIGRSLTLWDNVKLLAFDNYSNRKADLARQSRIRRARQSPRAVSLGYSPMPKTMARLFAKDCSP